MTLFVPDVNVLVYAFRGDSAFHDECAAWLNATLRSDRVGLADTIHSGFVRIVTHPRIFAEPTPTALPLEFAHCLAHAPRSDWLRQGSAPWDAFEKLAQTDAGVRVNLVPEAHIAALCTTNGAALATRDRGFARFPGLKRVEPGG